MTFSGHLSLCALINYVFRESTRKLKSESFLIREAQADWVGDELHYYFQWLFCFRFWITLTVLTHPEVWSGRRVSRRSAEEADSGDSLSKVRETKPSLFGGLPEACLSFHEQNKSYLVDPASNICLSQRLSHACLSINNFILWNCVQLIKSVIIYLMVSYLHGYP